MEETQNQSNQESSDSPLHEIRDMMKEFLSYIHDLREERDRVVDGIILDREQMIAILDVSISTIARWRQNGMLPYRVLQNNCTVYEYSEVYAALKRGDLNARGFNRMAALRRMKNFYDGKFRKDELNDEFLQ